MKLAVLFLFTRGLLCDHINPTVPFHLYQGRRTPYVTLFNLIPLYLRIGINVALAQGVMASHPVGINLLYYETFAQAEIESKSTGNTVDGYSYNPHENFISRSRQGNLPSPPRTIYHQLVTFVDTLPENVFKVEEMFTVAEQMPLFPGTSDKKDSDTAFLNFIVTNIRYPEPALKAGIEGRVYVQFVVTEQGRIEGIRTVQSLEGGCDEEAKRVIAMINDLPKSWTPGIQRGKKIRVPLTMPVTFSIDASKDINPEQVSATKYAYDTIVTFDPVTFSETITVRQRLQKPPIDAGRYKIKPLVIIDGKKMPRDFDLNSLEISQIESIDVIKDFKAHELYGEEGKNGVIAIKLKRE